MAIKKVTTKEKKEVKAEVKVINFGTPRITEKAARLSEQNAYTFDVAKNATKPELKKAFIAKYKKTPRKIAITIVKPRKAIVRGKRTMISGNKKAVIYLKKGETIDLA